jgi:hypothetical protein
VYYYDSFVGGIVGRKEGYMNRKTLIQVPLLVLLVVACTRPPPDITDLSLEELLSTDVSGFKGGTEGRLQAKPPATLR